MVGTGVCLVFDIGFLGRIEDRGFGSVQMGQVLQMSNDVRHKPAQLPVWEQAFSSQIIYAKDALYTDRDSRVTVGLAKGGEMSLDQNSWVLFDQTVNETLLKLERGRIIIAFDGQTSRRQLRIQNRKKEEILIDPAQSSLDLRQDEKGELRLKVLQGEATIQRGNEVVSMEANQSVQLAEKPLQIKTVALALFEPLEMESRYFHPRQGVRFQWSELPGSTHYRLVISQKEDLTSSLSGETSLSPTRSVALPNPGRYYWRVEAFHNQTQKAVSDTGSFELRVDLPPEIRFPKSGSVHRLFETLPSDTRFQENQSNGSLTTLSWKPLSDVEAYELQMSKDSGFQNVLASSRIESSVAMLPAPSGNEFFWRVRASEGKRTLRPWSETQHVRVEMIPLAKIDVGRIPAAVPVQILNDERSRVGLSWKAASPSTGYQIEVSSDSQFAAERDVFESKSTEFHFEPKRLGEHYWRVRALDPFGRETEFGTPQSIRVTVGVPQKLTPSDRSQVKLKGPGEAIELKWSKLPMVTRYQVEIGEDDQLKSPVFKTTISEPKVHWVPPKLGIFYWRVSAVEGESNHSMEMKPIRFETVAPPPSAPQVDDELNLQLRFEEGPKLETPEPKKRKSKLKKKRRTSWWEYVIPSAHAEEPAFPHTEIKWPAVDSAQSYVIQISTDRGFSEIILETQVSENVFHWKNARRGTFYFRVAVRDNWGRQSDFSKPSKVFADYKSKVVVSLKPKPGTVFSYIEKKPKVEFAWESSDGAQKTILLLSQSVEMDSPKSFEVRGSTKLVVPDLDEGEYSWRTVPVYPNGDKGAESSVSTFVIKKENAKAELSYPERGGSFESEDFPDGLKLQWEPISVAKAYTVELSFHEDFKEIFRKISTQETHVTFKPEIGGMFYWRVVTKHKEGETVSEGRSFRWMAVPGRIEVAGALRAFFTDPMLPYGATTHRSIGIEGAYQLAQERASAFRFGYRGYLGGATYVGYEVADTKLSQQINAVHFEGGVTGRYSFRNFFPSFPGFHAYGKGSGLVLVNERFLAIGLAHQVGLGYEWSFGLGVRLGAELNYLYFADHENNSPIRTRNDLVNNNAPIKRGLLAWGLSLELVYGF